VDILYSSGQHFVIQDEFGMKTFLPDLIGLIIFMLFYKTLTAQAKIPVHWLLGNRQYTLRYMI
jgi:hypothetical protein